MWTNAPFNTHDFDRFARCIGVRVHWKHANCIAYISQNLEEYLREYVNREKTRYRNTDRPYKVTNVLVYQSTRSSISNYLNVAAQKLSQSCLVACTLPRGAVFEQYMKRSDPIRITLIGDGNWWTRLLCWETCFFFFLSLLHFEFFFQALLIFRFLIIVRHPPPPPLFFSICLKTRNDLFRIAAQVGKTSLINVYVSEEFIEEVGDDALYTNTYCISSCYKVVVFLSVLDQCYL